MKKILFAALLVVSGFGSMAAGKSVSEKLLQIVRETYPGAVEVNWLESPETYTVSFKAGAVRSMLIFTRDGTFIRSTRYYTEEYLPFYLIAAIHAKYPVKKIYGVTEVSSFGGVDYYIKLEDAKTWMTIKVGSDGSIALLEKFNKG
jgi:hypothetical protein